MAPFFFGNETGAGACAPSHSEISFESRTGRLSELILRSVRGLGVVGVTNSRGVVLQVNIASNGERSAVLKNLADNQLYEAKNVGNTLNRSLTIFR